MTIREWKDMLYRQEDIVMGIIYVTAVFALLWFSYPKYRRWLQWLPVLLIAVSFALPFVSLAVTP